MADIDRIEVVFDRVPNEQPENEEEENEKETMKF